MNSFLKSYKFTLFVLILMLVALLMPLGEVDTGDVGLLSQIMAVIPFSDKLVHMGMFSFVTLVNYGESSKHKRIYHLFWMVGLCGFAWLTEVLQKLSGYRTFDVLDIVADLLGIVLGLAVGIWVERGIRNQPS